MNVSLIESLLLTVMQNHYLDEFLLRRYYFINILFIRGL